MRPLLLILVLAGLGVPALVEAQTTRPPNQGDRVRLSSPNHDGVFRVISVGPDTLVVRKREGEGVLRLPLTALERLEIDRGSRSRGQGAGRGMLIGGLVGGAVGFVAGLADGDDECAAGDWCIFEMSAGEKAIFGGVTLGGVGVLVGGTVGALTPGRRWESVALPLDVGVAPAAPASPAVGGVALVFRVSF